MKISYKFFCFFLLIIIFTSSQNMVAQKFEPVSKNGTFNFGLEGGVQFTSINEFVTFYVPSSKVGFTAGLFGEYYLNNEFKVKVAACFDNRPFELTGNVLYIDTANQGYSNSYYLYQVDYKVNYLTIPIGFGYEKGGDKFKLIVNLNFYYSILLNASMKGNELYYFDPVDGFDLSNTILKTGLNEFSFSGATEGVSFKAISNDSQETNRVEKFNPSDFGINLSIGGLYQATPQLGIGISFGFGFSFDQAFENPQIDSKWSQITKINLGLAYSFSDR